MQRLAVFVGGWTLDAAEEVCGADSGAEGAVLDLLSALVDKSLVQAREEDGAVRYGFLETLRAYAQERLEASGDHEHAARRHAAYYLALAEQAEPALWGPRQISWFRRLAAEQDNLRAAIEWALAHDEITLGLRLAGALWRFWMYQGDYGGWRRMIEAGLARETGAPVPAQVRVKALNAAGWLAFHQWEYAATAALGAQSLRLARAGRPADRARCAGRPGKGSVRAGPPGRGHCPLRRGARHLPHVGGHALPCPLADQPEPGAGQSRPGGAG